MSHLFSIAGLGREGVLAILDRAELLRTSSFRGVSCQGRILGLFFFQPSARTRFGFHAAMARLGGTAIELTETKFQAGMSRPESLPDVMRSVSGYCDALVLRHESAATFREAMESSSVPVINGGCGVEHHPTQALIDLFAIRRRFGRLDGLRIGLAGNLADSRSARSFLQGLAYFPWRELRLISPPGKEFPISLLAGLPTSEVHLRNELDVEGLDVLYMTGLPEGTGPGRIEEEARERFRLTRERAENLPASSLVLNPLPRIDEIAPEIDSLPIAGYFQQSQEAIFVRCAVLERVLAER
ncbi:MAG TPA: aspartate carbamoyltransferase [Thermoanaerobaculia bacterium]|nr:aspartate carbamoyltransferase [Thermoanaerobaculia bacterium]